MSERNIRKEKKRRSERGREKEDRGERTEGEREKEGGVRVRRAWGHQPVSHLWLVVVLFLGHGVVQGEVDGEVDRPVHSVAGGDDGLAEHGAQGTHDDNKLALKEEGKGGEVKCRNQKSGVNAAMDVWWCECGLRPRSRKQKHRAQNKTTDHARPHGPLHNMDHME